MSVNKKEQESLYIFILKALAIFCVVCAHTSPVNADSNDKLKLASAILNYIGTMGVPVFLLISGFFFAKRNQNFVEFWKRKLISIVVPWIFCESCLWIYIVIRKGDANLISWIKFIIGYNHSTYYLTVLLVLYLLFWKIKKNYQLYIILIISLFSWISTGWGCGIDFINSLFGNYYLNPLNWAAFFAVGMLISNNDRVVAIRKIIESPQITIGALISSIIYFYICCTKCIEIFYFSKFAIISHIINIIFICGLAEQLVKIRRKRALITIGKYSFSIYLLHQFVSGIIVNLTNRVENALLVLARPVVVITVVMLGVYVIRKINIKTINALAGIRP